MESDRSVFGSSHRSHTSILQDTYRTGFTSFRISAARVGKMTRVFKFRGCWDAENTKVWDICGE